METKNFPTLLYNPGFDWWWVCKAWNLETQGQQLIGQLCPGGKLLCKKQPFLACCSSRAHHSKMKREAISDCLPEPQAPLILKHSTVWALQSSIFMALVDGSNTDSFSCVRKNYTQNPLLSLSRPKHQRWSKSIREGVNSINRNPIESLVKGWLPIRRSTSRRGEPQGICLCCFPATVRFPQLPMFLYSHSC